MNEFERKLIDIIERNSYIASFADPSKQIVAIEQYAYSVDKVAIALTFANPLTFPLIMDSDSDFVVTSLVGGAHISDPVIADPSNGNRVVEFSPAIDVQITDDSSGKNYWNIPTPLPLIAGTGGFPYMFVNPRVVRPRSTLQIAASISQDLGVTYSGFFFTLHGAKIYYAGMSA